MKKRTVAALAPAAGLAGIALKDLLQKEQSLRRNFPVVARLRYLLESVGPEVRPYIIATNDSERPFSRDQRRWVYSSAKGEQLLRVRHGQRHRERHIPDHQAGNVL